MADEVAADSEDVCKREREKEDDISATEPSNMHWQN